MKRYIIIVILIAIQPVSAQIHSRNGVTNAMINKAKDLIAVNELELNNLTISNEKVQYEAETSINLENVTVQNNSTLYLRAGQSITLESNITIGTGCNLKAITQSFCQ